MEFYYGIDASKGYADFTRIAVTGPKKGNHFKLIDNKEGTKFLLDSIKEDVKYGYVYLAVESTGGYENNWYNNVKALDNQNVKIVRINPIRIHHESKKDMQRNITDKISSLTIANHLRDNKEKLLSLPVKDKDHTNLTRLIKIHQMYVKQRTQILNSLEKLVYDTMPGLLSIWSDSCPQYLFHLLIKFPSKSKLLKTQPTSIASIKNISYNKAVNIIELVKNDAGIIENSDIKSFEIRTLATRKVELDKSIREVEKKFLEIESFKKSSNILSDIKGIGVMSATLINIEIGDITRFTSASQICGYYGTHPEKKVSGDGQTKSQMSKKGSPRMRSILYMVAKNLVLHNPYFKELYAEKKAEGQTYDFIIGIVMNKALRMIYGILKSGKPFDINKLKKSKNEVECVASLKKEQEKLEKITENLIKEKEQSKISPISSYKKSKIKKQIEANNARLETIRQKLDKLNEENIKAIEESQNDIKSISTRSSSTPETNI